MPKVSVIIPYYNHGAFLLDALDSVKNQTFPDFEVIIVNDGSTDFESLKIFESISNIDFPCTLISQENFGPSVARNNALKIAKGIYIVMLDADDLIRKDTINSCVEKLDMNKNLAVVYGNCMWFDEKKGLKKQRNFDVIKQLRANEIAVCSVIRKEALESAGGFDEYLSLKGLEDWDLWLSLYENGWEFCYVDDVMFDIRVSFTSRTFEVANNKIEELTSYVYKKHSDLLASQFIRLYHENKNFKCTTDYRIGNSILTPFRFVKNIFRGFLHEY